MKWSKTLLGGVLGGLALMLVNFLLHGVLMAETYRGYPEVFEQEASPSGPVHFAIISVLITIFLAIVFAKTRSLWARGIAGGLVFGLLVGMTHFFTNFYDTLVYDGFPYYLAWCHGAMDAVAFAAAGAVLGLVLKS
jgi:hypothetical protein